MFFHLRPTNKPTVVSVVLCYINVGRPYSSKHKGCKYPNEMVTAKFPSLALSNLVVSTCTDTLGIKVPVLFPHNMLYALYDSHHILPIPIISLCRIHRMFF
jgi:hypothetical protein